jgi:C4-dicarboxylate transporter DctQ subunit
MLQKIEKAVSCSCVAVMAILVFANVIARKVFNHSLAVSDEMSTYLFVLMSFMGTAIAARRGAHLGLSIVTDRLSGKAKKGVGFVMYLISAFFCLLILIFGVQMVVSQYNFGQETAAMQWPEWIYGSFVPIGAFFAMIAFLSGALNYLHHGHPGAKEDEFSADLLEQAMSEETEKMIQEIAEEPLLDPDSDKKEGP